MKRGHTHPIVSRRQRKPIDNSMFKTNEEIEQKPEPEPRMVNKPKPIRVASVVPFTLMLLGMHRAGTSMLSKILIDLGVDMGRDFPKANSWNRQGYWEDKRFITLNANILHSVGADWLHPPTIEKMLGGCAAKHGRIRHLIAERVAEAKGKPWGWKDPRTVITAMCYWPVIPEPVKVVIITRPQEDIVQSLRRRGGQGRTLKQWRTLVRKYREFQEYFVETYEPDYVEVKFKQLIKQSTAKEEVQKLAQFLGIGDNKVDLALRGIHYRK